MIDEKQIAQWWEVFVQRSNGFVEVRGISPRTNWSGYFGDINNLIRSVKWMDEQQDVTVYFTLNQIHDDCYERLQNEHLEQKTKVTTSDQDITKRKFVLIDLDPKRSVGINSNDEELAVAKSKASEIYQYLRQQGFEDMILALSGNGYHLLIPCDIDNTNATTNDIKRFLQTLAMFFNSDKVEVDCSVFNPSRICKLYGTVAKKGRDSQKRPRRMSRIVYQPENIRETPLECFQRVAALYPEDNPAPSRENGWGRGGNFDLEDFMKRHGIQYRPVSIADGTKYVLDHCPFDENHKGKDAVIFQRSNGAIGFHCFHNSCQGRTWRDVRLLFEPDAYSKQSSMGDPYRATLTRGKTPPMWQMPTQKQEGLGDVWLRLGDIPAPEYRESDYIKSGLEQIDSLMMGFRRGHVSVWCGKRGCGKSSLLNEIALNAANYGSKTVIWSGELNGGEISKWFFLQAAAHHTMQSKVNEHYFYTPKSAMDVIRPWVSRYIRLYNNLYGESEGYPYSKIENDIKEAYKTEVFDVIVLDNLMILGLDDVEAWNINEQQKKLMIRLHNLAMELNVHIHLVAHPNKQQGFLRPDNISGSGHIADLAQNVFLMHRTGLDFEKMAKDFLPKQVLDEIKSSGCSNLIEIAKCRDKGTAVGRQIRLFFDVRNNQLQEGLNQTIHYGWEEEPVGTVAEESMGESEGTAADMPAMDFDSLNYDDDGKYVGDMPF